MGHRVMEILYPQNISLVPTLNWDILACFFFGAVFTVCGGMVSGGR